jgi:DNA polymerase-4
MRSILYIDPPAFCTTVEALVAPALRSRPVAVAAPGADRATILALSAEARAAGIVQGMAVAVARKRCPDLLLLPPNPRLYARASRALHEVLRIYAPVIEPRGYGHAFLDLTGTTRLFGSAADVAARITREARARFGLPLTVGVAINKLVSEAATRVGRLALAEPLIEVPGGNEAWFLAPQVLAVLPSLPADIRERLDEYHLCRIGEVAAIRETDLCAVFGWRGRLLRQQARGVDPRPVLPPEVRAELRAAHTLATDTNDRGVLHQVLRRLTEQVGARLRRRGLAARRLAVTAEYSDHEAASHTVGVTEAALDVELWSAARLGLDRALRRRVAVRTVTVAVDRLVTANLQLELWSAPPARPAVLQQAVDAVAARRAPRHRGSRQEEHRHASGDPSRAARLAPSAHAAPVEVAEPPRGAPHADTQHQEKQADTKGKEGEPGEGGFHDRPARIVGIVVDRQGSAGGESGRGPVGPRAARRGDAPPTIEPPAGRPDRTALVVHRADAVGILHPGLEAAPGSRNPAFHHLSGYGRPGHRAEAPARRPDSHAGGAGAGQDGQRGQHPQQEPAQGAIDPVHGSGVEAGRHAVPDERWVRSGRCR